MQCKRVKKQSFQPHQLPNNDSALLICFSTKRGNYLVCLNSNMATAIKGLLTKFSFVSWLRISFSFYSPLSWQQFHFFTASWKVYKKMGWAASGCFPGILTSRKQHVWPERPQRRVHSLWDHSRIPWFITDVPRSQSLWGRCAFWRCHFHSAGNGYEQFSVWLCVWFCASVQRIRQLLLENKIAK